LKIILFLKGGNNRLVLCLYPNGEHDSSLVCPAATKNRKEKKQTNRQVLLKSINSEHIQTRSKKGVVKSNPKYL